MYSNKRDMGITLIALVVTIVVLLILAGVSVSMLTGQNGLIKQTINANEGTEIACEKEQLQIAMISMKFVNEKDLITRKLIFQGLLDSSIGENKTKAYINGDGYTIHFLSSNRIYTIDGDGEVTKEEESILETDKTPGAFEGEGTKDNPYIIMSIEDLVFFSQKVNTNTTTPDYEYVKLGRTLDFTSELSYVDYTTKIYNQYLECDDSCGLMEALSKDGVGFKPISDGKSDYTTFRGEFDGQGYEIKNIYISSNGLCVGFFGVISTATIKSLKISGDIIQTTSSNNNCRCGGIVGYSRDGNCKIENCINNANITGRSITGGVVGQFQETTLTISSCYNTGKVTGMIVGGIIGTGNAEIVNCYNIGTLTSNASNTVGGISGGGYWAMKNKIYNCYNKGSIISIGTTIEAEIGGIYGYIRDDTLQSLDIINCYNIGQLEAYYSIGSIVSRIRSKTPNMKSCYYLNQNYKNENNLTTSCTDDFMKGTELITALNSYITSNEDEINTKGWAKWVKGEDEYPTLDFNTVWNGSEWITY